MVEEKKEASEPELTKALLDFIDSQKAGSPTNPKVFWIHLKPK